MATEAFLAKQVNDVLATIEKLSVMLEDGITTVMTGGIPSKTGARSSTGSEFDETGMTDDDLMDEGQAGMEHPLQGIADSVLGGIMKGQAGPQTPMQHFHAFKSAIRWTEPFILALIAFQVVMMLLCVWLSRTNGSTAGRLTIMAFIGILVRSAEYLNRKGEQHWESFATQDYFDKRGIFIAIMLCAPLLFDCLYMLMMFVREAGQLLIQVKRKELGKKSKQPKSKNESKEGSTTTKEARKKTTKEE